MMQRAWGAAAMVLLAGCGGGPDSSESAVRPMIQAAPPTPAATTRVLDVPDADVERMLDDAEARYPSLLPTHQVTLTAAPFRYRYYADSGIYLGVATQPDMGYAVGGVYVLGEAFGPTPLHIGPLSGFLLATTTSSAEQDNGCRNHALFDRAGTRVSVEYVHTGTITGNSRVDLTVLGAGSHGGRSTIESTIHRTSRLSSEGRTVDRVTHTHFFGHQTGVAEITDLGFDSVIQQSTWFAGGRQDLVIETQTTYPSGWVQRDYALGPGQSITQPRSGTVSTRVQAASGGAPQVTTSSISENEVTTFVGRETIKVHAGTYDTCKFTSHLVDAPNEVKTEWMIHGTGSFAVKSETTVQGVLQQTVEATSVRLIGRPL